MEHLVTQGVNLFFRHGKVTLSLLIEVLGTAEAFRYRQRRGTVFYFDVIL
jgi:hypothetical protein